MTNACGYFYSPPYVFLAWCLIKFTGNFTFTFHADDKTPDVYVQFPVTIV
jgi:hypothetical protein